MHLACSLAATHPSRGCWLDRGATQAVLPGQPAGENSPMGGAGPMTTNSMVRGGLYAFFWITQAESPNNTNGNRGRPSL